MCKGQAQLFVLATELYEEKNLAASQPQRVAELRTLLEAKQAKSDKLLSADLKGQPH